MTIFFVPTFNAVTRDVFYTFTLRSNSLSSCCYYYCYLLYYIIYFFLFLFAWI